VSLFTITALAHFWHGSPFADDDDATALPPPPGGIDSTSLKGLRSDKGSGIKGYARRFFLLGGSRLTLEKMSSKMVARCW
jgi:hypothetical protein